MLENWDKVKQYAETGATSAGTAMEKYGIVLESVESKQAQLTAKTQEFYSNVLSDSVLTGLLDIGNGLMDIVNIGDGAIGKILLLTTATLALSAVLSHLTDNGKKTFTELIAGFIGVSVAEGTATTGAGLLKIALDLLKAHPIILGLSLLTTALIAGKAIFDHFNVTLEEQHDKAQQAQSDYQEVANELKSVNSELETTKQRIAELEGKDALTFVEQEELKNLKETNAELESQVYWLEKSKQLKRDKANTEASKAWDKDFNDKGEFNSQYKWRTDGSKIGITENEHIQEQIQYLGELKSQIQTVSNAEGEWANKTTEQRETELERLRGLKTGVEEYLTDVGARIQNDFLDSYDVSDKVKKSWLDLQDVIRTAIDSDYVVTKFEEAIESLPQKIKDNFVNSDIAGSFKTLEEAFTIGENVDSTNLEKFKNALQAIGIEADDPSVLNYLNALSDISNNISVTPLKSYSTIINDVKDKVEALADAQYEMSSSGYVTADTVLELEKQFGDLSEYLTLTANGYSISKAGLDALNGSMLSQYQTALNEAKAGALNVLDQEHKKGLSYNSTTEAIKKQLQAQLALAQANTQTVATKLLDEGYTRSELPRSEAYQSTKAEIQAIQNAIQSIENAQTNYNRAKQTLNTIKTQQLASNASKDSSSKSSKEWWEESLDQLKDKLENNEITMNSYIKSLEKLRGKLKKGSEGFAEVNKVLQEAKLDNLTNQFERGEISIDKYISGLKKLRKAYKKDTEGYKELTKQIDEARLKSTEEWIEKLQKSRDTIEHSIDLLGDVNTAKEQTKYAELLSKQYKTVQSHISKIQKKLEKTNLTTEQRIKLQEELNALQKEEADIRDEIEDSVREYYENQKEQAEKQAELEKKQTLYDKEVALYGKDGKDLWEYNNNKKIEALEKQVEARNAEKEALDEINEREELENDLLEARLKLQNALNNKTTKILTKQEDGTWAYTFSANMADVKSAQEEVGSAQKALEDFDWEQETKELTNQIDELNANAEDLANQYQDAEFWANREYEQTINSIEQAYSDIDTLVEKWMAKYGTSNSKLTSAYQSLTTANNLLKTAITNLTTAIDAKYKAVGNNGTITPKSFDTGGEIVGTGLILAHDKERVLTQEQNANFMKLLDNIQSVNKLIDVSKVSVQGYNQFGSTGINDKASQTVINSVSCNFPNITTPDGLQKAILELPRLALQKKQ